MASNPRVIGLLHTVMIRPVNLLDPTMGRLASLLSFHLKCPTGESTP